MMTENTEKKKADILTKIVCAKCGKEDFVNFVPDGKRNYYCADCLTLFNKEKQRSKVKKIQRKDGKYMYEFLCILCDELRRQVTQPERLDGGFICHVCAEKRKRDERREKRKKVVLA